MFINIGRLAAGRGLSGHSFNATLAKNLPLLPMTAAPDELRRARVGHLYNAVVEVDIRKEADAIMFFPEVTPLEDDLA